MILREGGLAGSKMSEVEEWYEDFLESGATVDQGEIHMGKANDSVDKFLQLKYFLR